MQTSSRRQFLRAGATCLALPPLLSLLPRHARAAAASARRLAIFHAPCGFNMRAFTPKEAGAGYTLTSSMQPLADLKDDVLVLSNMANRAAIDSPQTPTVGRHALGLATLFTGARLVQDVPAPQVAPSVDQIYAQSQRGKTPVASMQLGVAIQNDCDDNYPCSYITSPSWEGASVPLPPQTNPKVVFDTYFAGAASSEAAALQAQKRARRKSLLDVVSAQATALASKLGRTDRAKLDQYLTSVRELEVQLAALPAVCSQATAPGEIGNKDFPKLYEAMIDMMVLAFQCDITRSISFTFGTGHCNHYYGFLPGVTDVHHGISHHNGDPRKLAMLSTIDAWEVSVFARFLSGLKKAPDAGGGTVLDNTAAVMSSELADGSAHDYDNLAVLLGGRLGGTIDTGRNLVAGARGDPGNIHQLWLALLHRLGVDQPTFGGFKVDTELPGLKVT